MVVDPVQTPHDSPVVSAVERAIGRVLDLQATLVARPTRRSEPSRLTNSPLATR